LDWPGISQRLSASGERIRRRAGMLPRDEIAPLLASVMFAPER
jgi:hypothetical protein